MTIQQVTDLDSRLTITSRGSVRIIEGEDVIKQSIKTILSTIPGERVRQPGFGSNIYSMLFEPMDEITVAEMESSIEEALEVYENRINIRTVRVIPDYENNLYDISIRYHNTLTNRSETFEGRTRVIEE